MRERAEDLSALITFEMGKLLVDMFLPALDLPAPPSGKLYGDGFEVETLIGIRAQRAKLKIAEVPCFESHRIHGNSNLHALRDGLRIFRVIIQERLRRYRVPTS